MDKKKFSFRWPSLSINLGFMGTLKLPALSKLRIPLPTGLYLGGGKLIMFSLSTVVLGFVAGMFLLISKGEQQITFPMVGAVYEAPSMVGTRIVDPRLLQRQAKHLRLGFLLVSG